MSPRLPRPLPAALLLLWLVLAACSGQAAPAADVVDDSACIPTAPDQLGPFYVAGAPVRDSIGRGHVLEGIVRSSPDCAPIPGAQIEFWQVNEQGEYSDDKRATVFADGEGRYRFESNPPLPYSGRPPHIHIRVSADRHETLVTQYYPQEGSTDGSLDLILQMNR